MSEPKKKITSYPIFWILALVLAGYILSNITGSSDNSKASKGNTYTNTSSPPDLNLEVKINNGCVYLTNNDDFTYPVTLIALYTTSTITGKERVYQAECDSPITSGDKYIRDLRQFTTDIDQPGMKVNGFPLIPNQVRIDSITVDVGKSRENFMDFRSRTIRLN